MVLVLCAVTDKDRAVGLDLLDDPVELLHERLVGLVPDFLIAADERHFEGPRRIISVRLHLPVDVHGSIERVGVGILGVSSAQGGGRLVACVHAYRRRFDASFGAEIVIAVDSEDQGLLHRLRIIARIFYAEHCGAEERGPAYDDL
jgi:hypothetical protein